jgi:hypothetical protein
MEDKIVRGKQVVAAETPSAAATSNDRVGDGKFGVVGSDRLVANFRRRPLNSGDEFHFNRLHRRHDDKKVKGRHQHCAPSSTEKQTITTNTKHNTHNTRNTHSNAPVLQPTTTAHKIL